MSPTRTWRHRLLALATLTATTAVTLVALPSAATAAGAPYRAVPVRITAPAADADTAVIPGAYLVTFRSGADRGTALRALKATARTDFGKALNGFAAALTEAQVTELSHSADVVAIERDAWHHHVLDTTQANPPAWGIDRIDQTNLPLSASYSYTATGAGVHAYIIDSGVDAAHPNFGGRAQFNYNAVDSNNTDCNGHGTHVAGTIGSTSYGVAKAASLHGVKWLNCAGSGTTSGAVAAVNWVTANHVKPAVANTSWNITYSATLATALTNMMNAGVFLATSAGNTGSNSCDRLPRNLTAALVVAATTSTDARASYSSTGSCVDIYGPGSAIVSTLPGNTTGSYNGTSMSTPHAAGIAVLYKATYGDASQATVHAWIVDNATTGVVTGTLSGTPNRLLNKRTL
ncbi:S8 family peptidase [Catellatospora sp. TT07R-123]|uniref:S8 family peptidase n=1 Tax=Catellatospora sp. TT07R-123 TaxID=2733863 RepID=UPI001FD558DC|nr:S8 family peptidase [Catellatospora sp. TT07R-123]